ncbi:MAG: choice-of-anchor D domain-containing protein [Myxococcota bacterium]
MQHQWWIFVGIGLSGCGVQENTSTCAPMLSAPSELVFDEMAVALRESQSLSFDLHNDSADCPARDLEISIERDDEGSFTFNGLSQSVISPGEAVQGEVVFAPSTSTMAEAFLVIEGGNIEYPVRVRLKGIGSAPKLRFLPAEIDFGDVHLGCAASRAVSVGNSGDKDLIIDALSMSAPTEELRLELPEDEPFPWTLTPGQQVGMMVTYRPADLSSDIGTIEVLSNDPRPSDDLQQAVQFGTGVLDGQRTDRFEPSGTAADVFFAVDQSNSMRNNESRFLDAFVAYIDELEAAEFEYQVAIVVQDSGTIAGAIPFINSTNAADARTIAAEMLSGTPGAFKEMAFTMFEYAYEANHGWLRDDVNLHLIGVSDEPEQSPGSWATYVSNFQDLKDDPDQVIFHAVGGDYPTGCGDVIAYDGLYQATVTTGGLFFSICEEDWTEGFRTLAQNTIHRANHIHYVLSERPLEATIEVFVDGVPLFGGWSFDVERNEVVFADFVDIRWDQRVEVTYGVAVDCD